MNNWLHKVQYYETDQMQIVHHSNYIRWFEEARTYLMEQIDFGYDQMEEQGIVVPVLAVQADYKSMSRFGETVEVRAHIKEFTGVKMIIAYEIVDKHTEEIRCTGETKHAFLDKETYRPLSLKRKHKNLFDLFNQLKDRKVEE
ncbi:acyl-CoA thioesterase [Alkalibacterium sp. MB6]|uniref:acyl-CoA thioesterase n=1 Tax=Alkalibacterium sp. MB6 TaxID=2081965 RepID=UPI00137ACA16|nr:acyl-CoA thioesterase [Alkalibacterium sp. MB6]